MSDATNSTETVVAVPGSTATPGVTPPVVATPPAAVVAVAPQVIAAAQPQAVAALAEAGEDDDEVPGEEFRMTKRALTARVTRGFNNKLKELGFENADEARASRQKLIEYEQKAEEARLAQLSEIERERELRVRAESQLTSVQKAMQDEREARVYEREQARMDSILAKHIDAKYLKYATNDLMDAINAASEDEVVDANQFLENWAVKYLADEHPEWKLGGNVQPVAAPVTPAPQTVPMSNGLGAVRPGTAAQTHQSHMGDKTASPGHPNSMSKAELQALKKSMGLNF